MKKHRSIGYFIFFMGITAFCFILYGNTITNDYSLDDIYVIQYNEQVHKGIKGIPEIFTSRYSLGKEQTFGYRPFVKAMFAVEYEFFGENPHVSHFHNILILIISGIALFFLLKRIFKDLPRFFPFAVLLLFLAHPIHTEVVASLKNREELMAFLGSILCLWFVVRFADTKKYINILWAFLAFITGVLSKLNAITVAGVIPLVLWFVTDTRSVYQPAHRDKGDFAGMFHILRDPFVFAGVLIFIVSAVLGKFALIFLLLIYWPACSIIRNRSFIKGLKSTAVNPCFITFGAATLILILLRKTEIVPFFNGSAGKYIIFAGIALFTAAVHSFFRFRKREDLLAGFKKIPSWSIWIAILVVLIFLTGVLIEKAPERFLEPTDKNVYYFENPLHVIYDPAYKAEIVTRTFWFYITRLIYPHPLACYYGYDTMPVCGLFSPVVIISFLFHLCILLYAIVQIRKKNVFAFGILFYFITLSPFLNIIIPVNGIVGERFLFMSSLGFCIIAVNALMKLLKIGTAPRSGIQNRMIAFWLIIALLLIPYSLRTINRNRDWKDSLTLLLSDAETLDSSAKIHTMAATGAIHRFNMTGNERGNISKKEELLQLAEEHSLKAIELFPENFEDWNTLGTVYHLRGNYRDALKSLKKGYNIRKDYETVAYNIGICYEKMKMNDSAIYYYNRAGDIDPSYPNSYINLANLYYESGDSVNCLTTIKKALHNAPDSDLPLISMGTYYIQRNRDSTAFYFEKALQIEPDNYRVCDFLIQYYHEKGNTALENYYIQKKNRRK